MQKVKRIASPTRVCPICKKNIHTRGWVSHMRMAHGKENSSAYVSGLSEGTNVPQKRKKAPKSADMTLESIIITFGIAWVLHKLAEHQKKQTLLSEGNKLVLKSKGVLRTV